VSGVPALVINGKYRLSSEKTEGYENMLKIADYLIEKERKAMAAAAK
jgi:thiol:disulfide interchange protein DsbA